MYLIFDTETTGLPNDYDAPHSDVANWPRIVQLAWEFFDARGRKIEAQSHLIHPDGFRIPKAAEKIHGISTALAMRRGVPIADALDDLLAVLRKSSVLVAHNLNYDAGILGAEFYRYGVKKPFRHMRKICTMKGATEYCALPGYYGFKWPRLEELHQKLFGKKVKETHDAAADTATCAKCFFQLKRIGVIRIKT